MTLVSLREAVFADVTQEGARTLRWVGRGFKGGQGYFWGQIWRVPTARDPPSITSLVKDPPRDTNSCELIVTAILTSRAAKSLPASA